MTRRELIVAIGSVMLTTTMAAQATPNFAGTWVADAEKTRALAAANGAPRMSAGGGGTMGGGGGAIAGGISPRAGGAGGSNPTEWTITQTAAAMTITRTLPDGNAQTLTYKLSGDSVNTSGRTVTTTKSHWEGAKFVTEGKQVTTTDQGAIDGTFKETRWLTADGGMQVETVRVVGSNGPATITNVLKKK